jgi:hypothetical protein
MEGKGACSSVLEQQHRVLSSVESALSSGTSQQSQHLPCSSSASAAKQQVFAGNPTNKASISAISF